jgi:hypothetical protein
VRFSRRSGGARGSVLAFHTARNDRASRIPCCGTTEVWAQTPSPERHRHRPRRRFLAPNSRLRVLARMLGNRIGFVLLSWIVRAQMWRPVNAMERRQLTSSWTPSRDCPSQRCRAQARRMVSTGVPAMERLLADGTGL